MKLQYSHGGFVLFTLNNRIMSFLSAIITYECLYNVMNLYTYVLLYVNKCIYFCRWLSHTKFHILVVVQMLILTVLITFQLIDR